MLRLVVIVKFFFVGIVFQVFSLGVFFVEYRHHWDLVFLRICIASLRANELQRVCSLTFYAYPTDENKSRLYEAEMPVGKFFVGSVIVRTA